MIELEKYGMKIDSLVSELREISVEKLNKQLTSIAADAIEQLVRERDAAVELLSEFKCCNTCEHCSLELNVEPCASCDSSLSNWEIKE